MKGRFVLVQKNTIRPTFSLPSNSRLLTDTVDELRVKAKLQAAMLEKPVGIVVRTFDTLDECLLSVARQENTYDLYSWPKRQIYAWFIEHHLQLASAYYIEDAKRCVDIPVTPELLENFRRRRRYRGRPVQGYHYRNGPVPGIRRPRGFNDYRSIRTYAERRMLSLVVAEDDEPPARASRKNVPSSWDEICRGKEKCWKRQHKGVKAWDRHATRPEDKRRKLRDEPMTHRERHLVAYFESVDD